jgi:hypothetical protein
MLNPVAIIFLGVVGQKELLETGLNLLIGQAAIVVGQTGQGDGCIRMTELGPGTWLEILVVSG